MRGSRAWELWGPMRGSRAGELWGPMRGSRAGEPCLGAKANIILNFIGSGFPDPPNPERMPACWESPRSGL